MNHMEIVDCPRCGIGGASKGAARCTLCRNLSDEQTERIKRDYDDAIDAALELWGESLSEADW